MIRGHNPCPFHDCNDDDTERHYIKLFLQEWFANEDAKKFCDSININSAVQLKFTKTRDVKSCAKANATDAGFDFFVPNDFNDCKELELKPGEDICIPSGIKVLVPYGYALIAQNKSGVATKLKLRVGACVVDTDYRGEVHIHLFNDNLNPVIIKPGMKIVQFVLTKIGTHQAEEISQSEYEKHCNTKRGEGAFGSTGE